MKVIHKNSIKRKFIDVLFGDKLSLNCNTLEGSNLRIAKYLVKEGFAKYILNDAHIQFLKYPIIELDELLKKNKKFTSIVCDK